MNTTFTVRTAGKSLIDITPRVREAVDASRKRDGLCVVFVRHTSASLLIQENADPAVRRDLEAFFRRLVPENDPIYTHTDEGPDDMPSHIRAALTATSIAIPVMSGALTLGRWQGVYLWEHRAAPHTREIVVHVSGA